MRRGQAQSDEIGAVRIQTFCLFCAHRLKRRKDGAEIFQIKKAAWVDYWLKQPSPVMLVIGTFIEDERNRYKEGSGKLEFDEVRWMEISSVLQQAQAPGKRPTQIEFKGERMDMVSIQAWRNRLLKL